jgi:hypothetical protein
MSATIVRQWHVLMMLPRPPRRIDTGSIEARLRERGIDVHRRMIQRDLLELAEIFPIFADERARPYGWRWSEDAGAILNLPMPAPTASTSKIEISLRVPRATLSVVSQRLGARQPNVSDDAKDPRFAIVLAAVDDSSSTRRLLLGHGDEVEVLAPHTLRREIAERARRVLAAHTR